MKKKFGFTIAEVLITLAVIGVVATVSMPILINNTRPNEEQIKFQKAFKNLSNIVQELINDESSYPNGARFNKETQQRIGFSDVSIPAHKTEWANNEVNQKAKFCRLVAERLILNGEENCTNTNYANHVPSFTTQDGVEWYIPQSNFGNDYIIVYIDVDGHAKGSNTVYDYNGNENIKPDSFELWIFKDGSLEYGDLLGKFYVKSETTSDNYKKYIPKIRKYLEESSTMAD